jgi:myo-inositol 2-dehydrogenase/D-chiro-inositol 1-dehydrogenase/scyllo-inositol 2-dehydrogenase (NAD+)
MLLFRDDLSNEGDRMSMDNLLKIGVCVIGSGRAGMIHARNFSHRVDKAQLVALVDAHKETLQTAQKEVEVERGYSDYRDALADKRVDAVVVVTPTVLHREVVLAAAKAGKHVLCEKPMAMDVRECDDMIKACEASAVKLQIGFMRRYDESFMAARGRIEAGEIGDVVLVKSLTHGPSVPQAWMYDIRTSNGPLAEVNSHDIDTLRWFAAEEIAEVYAIGGNFRCPQALESYPDFYDNVSMLCRFADGRQGYIDGAVSVGYGYDARTEILGTKGVMFVGRREQDTVVGCSKDMGITQSFVKSWRTLFTEAYVAEDQDFVDCIRENREPRVRGIDGRMAVAVVNAGNRSIRERVPVEVPAARDGVRSGEGL